MIGHLVEQTMEEQFYLCHILRQCAPELHGKLLQDYFKYGKEGLLAYPKTFAGKGMLARIKADDKKIEELNKLKTKLEEEQK